MAMVAARSAVSRTPARSAAARFLQSRFRSGGKVLGEEEKAAETVYIKVYTTAPAPAPAPAPPPYSPYWYGILFRDGDSYESRGCDANPSCRSPGSFSWSRESPKNSRVFGAVCL
jgi:hypothetical protein